MLELVICDDEKFYRDDLKRILELELDLCGISHHITEYTCGEDLVSAISPNDYQIIFLDIEMKELNGLAAAGKIREQNSSAIIIFVTSHPDFVFQGYDVHALNYILKPYQKEKITMVLHMALKEADISEEHFYVIEQRSGSIRLPLNCVKYFFSDKRSVTAVTTNTSYVFYGKLNDIEQELPGFFIRIHNRYLINLNFLNSIDNNAAVIEKDFLPISRSCKQVLAIAFAKYMLK